MSQATAGGRLPSGQGRARPARRPWPRTCCTPSRRPTCAARSARCWRTGPAGGTCWPGPRPAETYDTGLWQTAGRRRSGCAGLLVPEDQGGAGASYREAAVVAEELGRRAGPGAVPGQRGDRDHGAAVGRGRRAAGPAGQRRGDRGAGGAVRGGARAPGGRCPPRPCGSTGPRAGDPAGHLPADRHGDRGRRRADRRRAAGPGRRGALRPVRGAGRRSGRDQAAGDLAGHDPPAVRPDPGRRGGPAGRGRRGRGRRPSVRGAGRRGRDPGLRAARRGRAVPGDDRRLRQGAAPVRPARWARSRPSSTGWPTCTWPWSRPARRPGTRRPAWPPGNPDTPVAVALAKATCSDVALKAAQETIQLHGGIGFTWEHPAHLYLKRAKADSIALGTADAHRAAAGQAGRAARPRLPTGPPDRDLRRRRCGR